VVDGHVTHVARQKGAFTTTCVINVQKQMTEVTQLEDGRVEVKVSLYGVEAIGWVTSFHLAEPKANQLREKIVLDCRDCYR